jgi:hypothetical protein
LDTKKIICTAKTKKEKKGGESKIIIYDKSCYCDQCNKNFIKEDQKKLRRSKNKSVIIDEKKKEEVNTIRHKDYKGRGHKDNTIYYFGCYCNQCVRLFRERNTIKYKPKLGDHIGSFVYVPIKKVDKKYPLGIYTHSPDWRWRYEDPTVFWLEKIGAFVIVILAFAISLFF